MGNTLTTEQSTLDRKLKQEHQEYYQHDYCSEEERQENFVNQKGFSLFNLFNRTWNNVVDDGKRKKSRTLRNESSTCDEGFETDMNFTDFDDDSSLYGSQYSFCSCMYCYDAKQLGISGSRMSYCESDFSYSFINNHLMAPSAGKNVSGNANLPKSMTIDMTEISTWNVNNGKEVNQRPPVYNPEDYIQSLKKYGRRPAGAKSVYDTSPDAAGSLQNITASNVSINHSATLPRKNSSGSYTDYKGNPIKTPPESDTEMSLRQFGSITDLLTKLRADLRSSFPSFVQEFVATPLDGTSILLEVLRAVQLSQSLPQNGKSSPPTSLPRNSQQFQRRALLDELACLQCLSACVARSPEAGARLGTTPVGLHPLAAAATGQGIRSRIIALQLLTAACDKQGIGNGTQRSVLSGHTAVSEALSTLRLRCGEPVRFRLLVGMLNSGGGTGELQAVGLRFINTFLESTETTQNRLYLQAELFQAGLDPTTMTKTIASSSPWLEKIRYEVKKWEEIRIDVGRLQLQARESEKLRGQLVVMERRCQILQEEKSVLTSMERRLQERCADLQREIYRLQGTRTESKTPSNSEKRPIALPRQVPPKNNKTTFSDHDDEGISSSETGPSLSPEPERAFPKDTQSNQKSQTSKSLNETTSRRPDEDETNTTIDDVIEELKNIVSDAEREITIRNMDDTYMANMVLSENEIVPVNLLPQPPRKSRSLCHLLSSPSDIDGSDYGLLMINDGSKASFFEEVDYNGKPLAPKPYVDNVKHENYSFNDGPDIIHHKTSNKMKDSNRAILNVIMDAREKEDCNVMSCGEMIETKPQPIIDREQPITNTSANISQHFNGVFFLSDMNSSPKYPKPDITAALEAKRVTKNLDRMEGYGLDSMVDIVLTSDKSKSNFLINKSSTNKSPPFKFRGQTNAGLYSSVNIVRDSVKTFSNTGSKLTDLASGLY